MGYTHYWENAKEITPEQWEVFKSKCEKIISTHSDILEVKEISDDLIHFNGIGEDSHENFYVTREAVGFEFCKTAQKPYDLPVCMCLLALKVVCNWVDISSDGDQGDWENAEEEYFVMFREAASIFKSVEDSDGIF